jgi:hypothetical protein
VNLEPSPGGNSRSPASVEAVLSSLSTPDFHASQWSFFSEELGVSTRLFNGRREL